MSNYDPIKIEGLDSHTVRVYPKRRLTPQVGQLYLLRHYMYEKHALIMSDNAHQVLQNVNIYSFPGEGIIVGGDQHHFALLNCHIVHKKGQIRPITTTADGLHIGHSKGFIKVENCEFGNMGDDCVNLHDVTHKGVEKIDAHTLIAENLVAWVCPFAVGDPVEIREPNFAPSGFTGRVTQVKVDWKGKTVTLTFDRELPQKVEPNSILFNHRYGCDNYIIRNCYFHDNRARGVLAKANAGLIENNRFVHNQSAAMQLEADVDKDWDEGYGARNLVLRNNHYNQAHLTAKKDGAVILMRVTTDGHVSNYPLLENIWFENNVFENFTGPVVDAKSFKNLVFKNNEVHVSGDANSESTCGWLKAELGQGLFVKDNKWLEARNQLAPHLLFDMKTTKQIVIESNSVSSR